MSSKTFAEQFEALKGQKIVLVGMLFLFVIVIFWIGLSMFSSQTKFAVSKDMRDLAKPLTPTVKDSTLTTIEQKRIFSPEELTNFTIYKIVEEKGADARIKLVDINYVPVDEISTGTMPVAKPGGLSSYLQENPSFADSTMSAQSTLMPSPDATQSGQPDLGSQTQSPVEVIQPQPTQDPSIAPSTIPTELVVSSPTPAALP